MVDLPGYASSEYAHSFQPALEPVHLERASGWLLRRPIAGTRLSDAIGCYPLFCCRDWAALAVDLDGLTDLVSVSLVTDPFAEPDEPRLRVMFPDVLFVFKQHFIVDLGRFSESTMPKHHQRNLRSSRNALRVIGCEQPVDFLDTWCALYDVLTARHGISGIADFSRDAFHQQLLVPGMFACRAEASGQVVGMTLWMVHDGVAYYHLGAFTEQGYTLRAGYALFAWSLEQLKDAGITRVTLGAGAGISTNPDDGLSRFKSGWSNEQRPTYFCGRILDRDAYASLGSPGTDTGAFFPSYRSPEAGPVRRL